MEEFETIESVQPEKKKKPVFLVILSVLSLITIGFGLISALLAIMNGPVDFELLEEGMTEMYGMIDLYEEQGIDFMVSFIQKTIDSNLYINNEAFFLNQIFTLITLLIGLVAVIMMLKLKKIGYHLYIIYSFLPVITLYVVLPSELISTVFVIVSLIMSALFCLLYGLNLKHMK